MKRFGFGVALLCIVFFAVVFPVAADDGPVDEKYLVKIDDALLDELRADPDGRATFLVYMGSKADLNSTETLSAVGVNRGNRVYSALLTHASRAQAGVRGYLDAAQATGRVSSYTPLWIVNGLSVTGDAGTVWALAARDDVERIVLEREYRLDAESGPGYVPFPDPNQPQVPAAIEWNISKINADDVWATYGINGTGVLVANVDSGVMYDHAALVNSYAGNTGSDFDHSFHWFDAIDGENAPYDDNGHGTHTMGTVVGDDGAANQIGVAPGARWIAVKAFNSGGVATSTAIHEAFQWILAPCDINGENCDPARAPRIVSNSWGSNQGSRTEFLPDVQALRAAGIWPVFSAGNAGPAPGTIGSPASFAESFAVGATDIDDVVGDFSSRGPSSLTSDVKPDVTAPGVSVRSSLNDGGYASFSGTSMACPHVAGLGALLLSAEPSLTLSQIEDLITVTAVDLGDPGPDTVYGFGRVDALAAMQRLLSSGHLTGAITDAVTEAPIPFADVAVSGEGYELNFVADASGVYSATHLVAGTYAVTASYYGYEAATVSGVPIVTGTVTTQDLSLTAVPTFTLSGLVTESGTGTPLPATVRVLGTPLEPVATDAAGFYSIAVAQGEYDVEAHSFAHTTGLGHVVMDQDRSLNFELVSLPPILLVDDDEGDLRDYSPHVEEYYLSALEANDYNYTYWDIEAEGGAPDYETIRQYAAVVWFGGEFGRVKDISDADQAQSLMDYLDLGGQLFYSAQEHTFYYGDDNVCDTDPSACPFTYTYLDLGAFVQDRKADTVSGVNGDPVGDDLGPYVSQFPPFEADFADGITPGLGASAAFTASSSLSSDHIIAHTSYSPTNDSKVVFMAYPFEALPAIDAADVMVRIMDWFGIQGAVEGVTIAPAYQRTTELPGDAAEVLLRVRNLEADPEIYNLSILSATLRWPVDIMDAGFTTPITELGPVLAGDTADFGLRVQVPRDAEPGVFDLNTVQVRSQSLPAFTDAAQLATHARMTYYVRDSDVCGTGVHFDWVDATRGERYDIGGSGQPTYFSTTLPLPFTFYNQTYDHVYVNECGSLIFGDDNIYDDCHPTVDPPIPNDTLTDPNNGIHAQWGSLFWNPGSNPDQAVYTWYETGGGRNWFVVEWHEWDNLLGDSDTFQTILDLDTNEIIVQYLATSHTEFATAGIENAFGTEGVLYVWDDAPTENQLHDHLAVKYGVGQVPEINEVFVLPWWDERTVEPGGVVTYMLTISNTSSVSDTFTLEAKDATWTTTFWNPSLTTPLADTGPMPSCTTTDVAARVEVPVDAWAYHLSRTSLAARSQRNTLVVGTAPVTTTVAPVPSVAWLPEAAEASATEGIPSIGQVGWHTLTVANNGNVTQTFALSVDEATWDTSFWDVDRTRTITQTASLSPYSDHALSVRVQAPPWTYAGSTDVATLRATGKSFGDTFALATVTTTVPVYAGARWSPEVNVGEDDAGRTVPYLIQVRNEGNRDDRFALSLLGATWGTTIWNESFTQPITQTALLAPGKTQRVGVRVRIPSGATAPDFDTSLLRARSRSSPAAWADALVVTRVSRPLPGDFGVSVQPAGRLDSGAPLTPVTHVFTITNSGAGPDRFVLSLSEETWPTHVRDSTSRLGPGASEVVPVIVWVPESTAYGDWDRAILLVTSEGDAAAQDAVVAITVARPGQPVGQRYYMPIIFKAGP